MLTAFLYALRDYEDATLVLKLITSSRQAVGRVMAAYRGLDVAHRCRVVLIPDFLSDADMLELARASTFYLTTTRAEGNCLPLMNFLAAGRPGISPAHTAIADYFDSSVGLVVESHPEPSPWPQDSRLRWRTSWHRLVWSSLVDQIRRSYQMVKQDPAAYEAMSAAAQERMRQWSHPDAVWPHLQAAMEVAFSGSDSVPQPAALQAETTCRLATDGRLVSPSCPVVRSPKRAALGRRRVVVSLLNFRPGKIGGTETYLRKLIARLPHASRRHEIVLLMDRELAKENVFPDIERAVVDMNQRQIMAARGLEAVSSYRARAVEAAIDRLRPDVMFFPQQSIFPKIAAVPSVLVVHDLYHLFLPQYLSPQQRYFRLRNYAYSLSRADKIIAISHFTKKTIVEQYGTAPSRSR